MITLQRGLRWTTVSPSTFTFKAGPDITVLQYHGPVHGWRLWHNGEAWCRVGSRDSGFAIVREAFEKWCKQEGLL